MASAKLLLLGVLALAEAASISYPARPELDVNFNNFGFKFGAKFDSKESPRDGGKIYMDIPVNTLRRILRNPSVFEQILSPFKEEMYLVYEPFFFHRLYDVSNIKMEIEYNNEYNKDMTMMMNWNAKYAMTHQDGSEETGTIKMDSKVDSWWPQSWMVSRIYRYPFFNVKEGQMNLMVIPSGDMQTKFVFRPMEMKVTRTPQDVKFVYTFQNNKYEGHMVKNGRVYETKMMMTSSNEEVTPCEMVWKVDMEKKKAEFMRSENNVMKTNMMMEFEGQDMKTWTWKMTGSLERTWMWEDGTPMEWVVKRNGPKVEGSFTFNNFKFGKFNLDMEAKKFTANFFFFNGMFEVNFDVATGIYTVTLPKEWFGNFMTSFKDNKNIKMELKTEDFQWFNVGLVFDNFRNYKLYLPFKNTLNFYRDDVLFYTVLYQDKFIEPLGYEAEMLLESKDSKLVDTMFDVLRMDKDYFCRSMINGCFTKGKYTLKTLPELFYFQVEKEDQKVLEFDLKRKISPDTEQYVMKFFYPRWFMKTMNKQFDTLTMDIDAKYTVDNSRTTWPYNRIRWIYHHVTMKTNWDDWNMEMKRVPGNMWFTVKNNDFSRKFNVDYEMGEKKVNEFMTEKYMKHMKFTAMRNEELVADFVMDHKKPNTWKEMTTLDWMINFKDESFVHQKMCDFSTHLCFKNFNYKLQVKPNIVKYIPVSYNVDHTVTKDNKNVLDFQTRFQGEQLKSISMDTPYLVPFWKYITTPRCHLLLTYILLTLHIHYLTFSRSMLSRYFDPLPTMLSPFEIKVDMDFENGAKMRGNIDMNKFR